MSSNNNQLEVEILPMESDLYQTLENGADGKPGGILITSVGQEVIPDIWLGGYKALETIPFLIKNKITHILTLGHFKSIFTEEEFIHKVSIK
jgi:hypothetical protein